MDRHLKEADKEKKAGERARAKRSHDEKAEIERGMYGKDKLNGRPGSKRDRTEDRRYFDAQETGGDPDEPWADRPAARPKPNARADAARLETG